jgi:transcriptional regulator with XRE-family HTH domain
MTKNESPPLTFPQRLRLAREARGYSGAELALRAGLAQPHVWLLENRPGDKVREHTVRLLAKALRVRYAWLASGEGETPAFRVVRVKRSPRVPSAGAHVARAKKATP